MNELEIKRKRLKEQRREWRSGVNRGVQCLNVAFPAVISPIRRHIPKCNAYCNVGWHRAGKTLHRNGSLQPEAFANQLNPKCKALKCDSSHECEGKKDFHRFIVLHHVKSI